MKKTDFGKFIVFAVLLAVGAWIAFWLNNALFADLPHILLPTIIGILGAVLFWRFWQRPLQDQAAQIDSQAEELKHLHEEKHLFQSLFEHSNDIVYIVDVGGVFTYVNNVVAQVTGYKPPMLIGRHFSDFIKATNQKDLMAQFNTDSFHRVEVEFSTLDGRFVPLEINGRYFTTNSRETAVIGIARDISEKKQQEQQLQQANQTTELAILTRTSFLNNMGHELRTPLSVILGYTDMILQKAEREEDQDLFVLAQKVKRYAKDFSAIINDVLRMSEIESGQVGFLLEAFHIKNVIDQAIKQIQTHIDVNGNDLMLMVPPDIGTMIADRDKVLIVLINLLSNAAKFTENGSVSLSVTRKLLDDQSWIIFQVTDTGIGIPPEKHEQIFQPFLQGVDYVTKEREGVGLGLSINQHYCQLMEGRIEVESSLGEGSTFFVFLPAEVTAVESMFVRSNNANNTNL